MEKITRQWLENQGWVLRYDVYVLYRHPRMGWKPDGTMYIGYHTYPEKVFTINKLNEILIKYGTENYNGEIGKSSGRIQNK